ncbi:hypothetical protein GQ42DRAFT_15476 [Ramicandelaber brevisporus]|nr:hypothetical protein GQ42DRAFT_15476 [Ramicandelaber brevisporus]
MMATNDRQFAQLKAAIEVDQQVITARSTAELFGVSSQSAQDLLTKYAEQHPDTLASADDANATRIIYTILNIKPSASGLAIELSMVGADKLSAEQRKDASVYAIYRGPRLDADALAGALVQSNRPVEGSSALPEIPTEVAQLRSMKRIARTSELTDAFASLSISKSNASKSTQYKPVQKEKTTTATATATTATATAAAAVSEKVDGHKLSAGKTGLDSFFGRKSSTTAPTKRENVNTVATESKPAAQPALQPAAQTQSQPKTIVSALKMQSKTKESQQKKTAATASTTKKRPHIDLDKDDSGDEKNGSLSNAPDSSGLFDDEADDIVMHDSSNSDAESPQPARMAEPRVKEQTPQPEPSPAPTVAKPSVVPAAPKKQDRPEVDEDGFLISYAEPKAPEPKKPRTSGKQPTPAKSQPASTAANKGTAKAKSGTTVQKGNISQFFIKKSN